MASQMFVDLYGCDRELIDSEEDIKQIANQAVEYIGAEIVEECVHKFEPIGITYFAVITTSHFSIHTWPEYGYAAIDIFSCGEEVTEKITDYLKNALKAEEIRLGRYERIISDGKQSI